MAGDNKETKELNAEIKKLLSTIEILESRKKDIQERINVMITEVNKPVMKAKEEADKIIKESIEKARGIDEVAKSKAKEITDRASGIEREANDILVAVKNRKIKDEEKNKEIEAKNTDVESDLFARESNLKSFKLDADALMGNALTLQTEQSARKRELDSRESTLIKKEDDYLSKNKVLEESKKNTNERIAELRALEQAHADALAEQLTLKASNDGIVEKLAVEDTKQKNEIAKIKKSYDLLKEKQVELDKKIKDNTNQLNQIAGTNAKLDEKEKTLHEKERLNKLLLRQVDEKIRTLNKLRAGENA